MRAGLVAWLLASASAAIAQPADPPVEPLPAVDALEPAPWAVDHQWRPIGPRRPMQSVRFTPAGSRLALTADGDVLRAGPDGPWRRVLGGATSGLGELQDDERLLLEAETTVDEAIQSSVGELDAAERQEAQQDPTSGEMLPELDLSGGMDLDLPGDLDASLQEAEELDGTRRDEPQGGAIWASQDREGLVLVGRADGIWRSDDDGRSFQLVDESPSCRAFLELVDGRILAGGPQGLLRSEDGGRSFQPLTSQLGAENVWSLAAVGQALFAGTDTGLFLSADGRRWQSVPAPPGAVRGVLADPDWEGGLWLWTERALYRSDDLGQSFRLSSRTPLPGTRAMIHLGTQAHLLLVGMDGAWESTDGGIRWEPLTEGLLNPELVDIQRLGEQIFIAGAAGLQQLLRRPKDAAADETDPSAAWARLTPVPLHRAVGAALSRPGVDLADLSLGKRVWMTQFVPRLNINLQTRVTRDRSTNYDSLRTSDTRSPSTRFEALFCWGACGSSVFTDGDSYDVDVDDLSAELSDERIENLAVVDGEVYDLSEAGAIPAVAANVAQRATSYRSELSRLVTAAWSTRQAVLADGPILRTLPIGEQVNQHLLLQEAEARLDLYTDGWFRQQLTASPTDPSSSP